MKLKYLISLLLLALLFTGLSSCDWLAGTEEKSVEGRTQELYDATNQEREKSGLKPLIKNDLLDRLAREHAEFIYSENFPSHKDFEKRSEQILAAGFNSAAENIGFGGYEASSFIEMFMESEQHRSNMLDRRFTQIGCAIYGKYAVQIFAGY